MDYRRQIQKALDYIEENLKSEFDMADLARIAGYSEYHFLRVFRETVGLTPADYIRKRRITEIVRCMVSSHRPICDIAFDFGFNSKENFSRAFKREHHILPTEFRVAQNSLKLYERVILDSSPCEISARLVSLPAFRLIVYPSDEDFAPHFWNKYNANGWSKRLSGGETVEDFGVSSWDGERKRLKYYIGIRETDAKGDRSRTECLEIPGGLYAVFKTPPATHIDFVSVIHQTWDYIGRIWLPESGYRRSGGYEFESYVEESRLYSETIYIPITKERIQE